MEHKPCRLVIRADHTLQLECAKAFLARRHQLRGEHPFRQWNMRPLHHGSDRDTKLAATVFAIIESRARALALEFDDPVVHYATTRADGAIWPKHGFYVLARLVVIVENRV